MQRVKRKENKLNTNTVKLKELTHLNLNNISNGNITTKNLNQKTYLNNNIIFRNRSNKFLSIPERQKIIHEINQSNNQLNLYQPSLTKAPLNTEGKNILYIKKTQSNINILDKVLNTKKIKKNQKINTSSGTNTNLKFTKNKNLINKTIKEYYKKNEDDNPFKTYLKSLNNNDLHINKVKKHNSNQVFSSENNKKINYIINSDKDRANDIYKKPISIKASNIANVNIENDYIKNNFKFKRNNYKSNTSNTSKVYINNSAKKEKINCTKMINNNGVKKNIFNIIDKYNTKTIKHYTAKDNKNKIDSKKQNNSINDLHIKKNSYSNFNGNKMFPINDNKQYFYNKINNFTKKETTSVFNVKNNNSCKNSKAINIFDQPYFEEQVKDNNNINSKLATINDYYTINNKRKDDLYNCKKEMKINYNTNNNMNLKYTKKNIKSPEGITLSKRRIYKNNFPDDEFTRKLVENDLNYYLSPNVSNLELQNNGKINKNNENNESKNNQNNKYFYETELMIYKKNNNERDKDKKSFGYINTEVKKSRGNKSMSLSLEESSKKENKRNKSFSYVSNKDEENDEDDYYKNGNSNYGYGLYNNKYQNGKCFSPSYINKYNLYKPNKTLITKEIIFPFGIKNNNSFYNSDDDIMNSNNNSNIGSFNDSKNNMISCINYNNSSFDNRINDGNSFYNKKLISSSKSNNNIFTPIQSPSPIKDYYFNYLSNKINNDFLNENKFNNIEKNIYNSEFLNKNTFCDKCKRNYCPYCCGLSRGIDINNNNFINRKITPLKYINNYYPNIIHSRTISMNNENNILKKDLNKNNNEEGNNNTIKKKLITRNIDLKLDVSNGKHSSENNNQNININAWEGGSFNSNSNKLEITGNDINITIKNDVNKNEQEKIKNEEKKNFEKINEIKDKEINIEEVIKNNKESEIDKTEQTKSLSQITSFDKNQQKNEGINLSNNEFLLNENNNNENSNKKDLKNISLLKAKEEKEIKNFTKMDEIIQNIQATPKTDRNSSAKDNSINNNETNITKTDIDINNNIINNNSKTISKNLVIKEDLTKKNYVNNKNQSESPLLSDILEYLNLITPNNYFTIKEKILNIIVNNESNIALLFVNILYPTAINQPKFQPIYAKLCKDLDKYHNKKDKSKSVIRTQLMKFCKTNFKKIKFCLENIVNIVNDINFIGELIMASMVSKKVGIQCLNHLVNKFNQYNSNKKLVNKKNEKYIYLDSIVNLLNKFGTCIYCYQKNKIREDEYKVFNTEINKNITLLKEMNEDKLNKDMPNETKLKLIKLIEKSDNKWELTEIEKYKNKLLKNIYEESSVDNNNINNNIIKINSDNNNTNNNNTNKDKDNNNKNKQLKSFSPSNNIIKNNESNNNNNDNKKATTNKNTEKINNNININKEKILSDDCTKIIIKNMDMFKSHVDEFKSNENFNDWEAIDNLFLDKKKQKNEIFISILEACKQFIKDKSDINYVDTYIKIVFEYYYNYLNKSDFNGIINSYLVELNKFAEAKIKNEENKYEIEVWIIIIYYLLLNKIMTMNDFNFFCKGYSKEIKTIIFNILNDVCCYNNDNKHFLLKELKNTKFANMNKKILSNILQTTKTEN